MNCWGTKTLALLAAVALAGCTSSDMGESLPQVQQAAQKELAGLRFFADGGASERQIGAASTVDEVRRVLETAKTKNAEKEARYWSCVEPVRGVLSGALWSTQVVGDGRVEDLLLTLDGLGAARLENVGHAEMVTGFTPGEFEAWLVGHVGKVEGWSANLDELVEQHRVLERDERPYVSGPSQCNVYFDLELTLVGGVKEQVPGRVERGPQQSVTLFLSGVGFEWAR